MHRPSRQRRANPAGEFRVAQSPPHPGRFEEDRPGPLQEFGERTHDLGSGRRPGEDGSQTFDNIGLGYGPEPLDVDPETRQGSTKIVPDFETFDLISFGRPSMDDENTFSIVHEPNFFDMKLTVEINLAT